MVTFTVLELPVPHCLINVGYQLWFKRVHQLLKLCLHAQIGKHSFEVILTRLDVHEPLLYLRDLGCEFFNERELLHHVEQFGPRLFAHHIAQVFLWGVHLLQGLIRIEQSVDLLLLTFDCLLGLVHIQSGFRSVFREGTGVTLTTLSSYGFSICLFIGT